MKFDMRTPLESDIPFIYASWLTSYRHEEDKMTNTMYFEKFKKILTSILEKSHVIVACSEEDPEHVYGYIVYEKKDPVIVHYILVKQTFQRLGIGTKLKDQIKDGNNPMVCTFAGFAFTKLKNKWRLTYNPWLR